MGIQRPIKVSYMFKNEQQMFGFEHWLTRKTGLEQPDGPFV